MNRSITGAWASHHRSRTRVNLNAPLPPGSAAAAAAQAAKARKQGEVKGPGNGDGEKPTEEQADESKVDDLCAPSRPNGVRPEGQEPHSAPPNESTEPLVRDAVASSTDPSSPLRKPKVRPRNSDVPQASGSSKRSRQARTSSSSSNPILARASLASKYPPPNARLKDLGGLGPAIEKLLELVAMPLCHPEIYAHTGVKAPRGVLLHGPPGCGKTMLAAAIAGDLSLPFISVSAPSIVSGTSGESEATLRNLFDEAASLAPCILFLDEIDAITPKRETAQREMERRIVAQLLTSLDDLSWDKTDNRPVMIIGATNRPDSLDPALRRAGRFDHEIALGVPDEEGREQILRVLSSSLRLSGTFDFKALAKATPGYVGADLVALTAAAGVLAVKRIFNQMGSSALKGELNASSDEGGAYQAVDGVAEQADMAWEPQKDGALPAMQGAVEAATAPASAEPACAMQDDSPLAMAGAVVSFQVPSSTDTFAAQRGSTYARPSDSFFDALPASMRDSPLATFLRSHPSPLNASQLESLSITHDDFLSALPSVQPSSKREGFATVPGTTWAEVGALHDVRDELSMAIVEPIRRPEWFRALGVASSGGVLLWGPPGCGKTLLAKAVANESGANFISVKGPELLNKYVGESERAVRQVFSRARTSSPCVIFFDELDALVPKRDDAQSEASSRVVNTLLTELDGLEARQQTYVIGATNRPDMIDPAMCRPGRLDKLLYVDLPTRSERLEILRALTKRTPLLPASEAGGVRLDEVAHDARAEGFSGADLAALTKEAAVLALREVLRSLPPPANAASSGGSAHVDAREERVFVCQRHFDAALAKVQPSVGAAQRARYRALRTRLAGGGGGGGTGGGAAAPTATPLTGDRELDAGARRGRDGGEGGDDGMACT